MGVAVFILGLVLKPYLTGYAKRKGENLATHEDIEKLVDQMKAVTQATKEIESRISGELWDRQKQWELKREVLFEASRRVSAIYERVEDLQNLLQVEVTHPEYKEDVSWMQDKADKSDKYFEALEALEESLLLVGMTCEKAVVDAIDEYKNLLVRTAAQINKNNASIFKESLSKILSLRQAVRDEIRKQLGIK